MEEERNVIKYRLKLYIVGQTLRSRQAVANLRQISQGNLAGHCDCEIVDVLEQPQQAEIDHVIATPTLIKTAPPPVRRVLGDLTDIGRVMDALGLYVAESETGER